MIATYSFTDINFVFSHPKFGRYALNGEGLGTVSVSMADDRTSQDVSADGSVVTNKIASRRGKADFVVQQTSNINRWFRELYNYLDSVPTENWALSQIYIEDRLSGEVIQCFNVAFQKKADKTFQQQQQNVTWSFLCGKII